MSAPLPGSIVTPTPGAVAGPSTAASAAPLVPVVAPQPAKKSSLFHFADNPAPAAPSVSDPLSDLTSSLLATTQTATQSQLDSTDSGLTRTVTDSTPATDTTPAWLPWALLVGFIVLLLLAKSRL